MSSLLRPVRTQSPLVKGKGMPPNIDLDAGDPSALFLSPPPAQHGPGARGLGKGKGKGNVRHHRHHRDTIQGITKPSLRRLARRGGVKRLSEGIYDETRKCLEKFLRSVIHDAVLYTEHSNRKTVTNLDVLYSLKKQGRTMYGFLKQ